MIVEKDGRSQSVRTAEEDIEALQKELEALSPEEREAFQLILDEFQHPPPDPSASLLHYLNTAEYKTPPVDMRTFIKDPYFLGNTCDNLYPKLLDDLIELFEGGYHEVVYTGCIDLDAVVQGANGSLRTIREWIGSKGRVVGFSPDGAEVADTGVAKHSGRLPVVALELANGMGQRLTPDHKVMTWRNGYEWVPAGEVEPGDFVVTARRLFITEPDSDLSVAEAKLLAYWCADGSSSEQRSRFCDGNPATSLEVVELLDELGFSGKRYPKGDNCWEVYVEEHKRSGFYEWLRMHGAHAPTAEVVVPDAVCRAGNAVVLAFLNRLWAAEGCVYANAAKSPPRFQLGMTSERFIRQVQLLLLREGIRSRVQFTLQFDKRSGKTTETWTLSVQGVEALTNFCAKVGPILGKEEAYKRVLSYVVSTAENTNVDIVPVRRKWLSDEMTRRGIVRGAGSRWWGLARGSGKYISRKMWGEWLEDFGKTALGEELAQQFPLDYSFERVTRVADAGEIEVGDICDVEGLHSFISNGIYSHNSIGWGKCLHGSTEVYDPVSGRRRRVDELGDLHVASMTEVGKIETRPASAFASGRKKCLELRLAAGQRITLSADHKVFTARGWVEAQHLVVADDLIATPRSIPVPSTPCVVTDDAVKLCAYLMADGGCTAGITFTNETAAILEEFVEVVKRVGEVRNGNEPRALPAKRQNAGKASTLNVRGVARLVKKWGIDDTSTAKRLPAEFYGLSQEHVRLFLNRFWACDGSISVAQPQKAEVTLASEGLIDDLAFLLLRLGIPSRKAAKKKFYRTPDGTKKMFPAWSLTVTGADNLLKFLDEVGPVFGKEDRCAALRDACSSIKPNTNTDVVPVGLAELRRIRAQLGDQGNGLTTRFPCPEGQLLGRRKFERLCAEFDYTGSFAWLATNDLRWEKLVAVEDVGMHDVYDLSVPETHSFVGNGVVVHNTFTASIGIARILYELSCLKDPHKTYGLAKDTNISIVCLSVNEALATKVVFENISIKIKASPYFQECFPFEATKKELRFPNNVWVAARATTDTSALGLNTISALVDETNFMATKGSAKNAALGGYIDHAEVIYNAIKRRMKSRFEKKGKLPGMLFIVSSKKTMDDFTARRVRESKNDPSVFVRDYALWDVKEENFSKNKFWVVVGNDQTPSRILADEAEAKNIVATLPEGVVLIDVPEDFRPDFERDLEGAIRDLAGCATVAISPFIQRREKILKAVDPVRNHPFSVQVFDPSRPGSFLWEQMVRPTQERDLTGSMTSVLRPIVNPTAGRHIHIDPSLRGDSTGFVMSHICGWKDVRRRGFDGAEYLERAPLYFVDFMLQIIPPIGDEIILGDVRRLVYDLSAHGYMITSVTMDSWQSADALQQLSQRGYNASLLSMDTSMDPYENLKTALYEDRVVYYHYPPLIKELQQLERDSKRRKIDHPPRGSKDVADALAGSLFSLAQQRSTQPLPILSGSAYYGDAWMSEQRQSVTPSASANTDLRGDMPLMPLPLLGGGRGGDGW